MKSVVDKNSLDRMEPVPKFLYYRDIVELDKRSDLYRELKSDVLSSEWVKRVVEQQWQDGSWGRFHSLSTSSGLEFTTEKAMRRLFALGLDKEDEPIKRVIDYMEAYLKGEIELRDRVEKRHDWRLLTRLFVVTWMKKFKVENDLVKEECDKWAKVITTAFQEGSFDNECYTAAYKKILKPEPGKSIWGIQNFYIVSLMSGLLDVEIEKRFLDFIMTRDEGIYYIYDGSLFTCPTQIRSLNDMRFLAAQEILSDYKHYSSKADHVVKWLMDNKNEKGLWDFGSKAKDGVYLPLSSSWRKKSSREQDCSLRALRLLKRIKPSSVTCEGKEAL